MPDNGSFKDHFSDKSDLYARYRPGYPPPMFEYLQSLCAGHARAWDCATGSGQAALLLAPWFNEVVASDASADQIHSAIRNSRIRYVVATAENSGLDDASVDLITVGQALHWFDTPAFFAEAERVLQSGGVLAAWCYENCIVSRECDVVVAELYDDIVGAFWPAERRFIDEGYASFKFPGNSIEVPSFDMETRWTVDDMLGYLRTWSACKRYQARHDADPVAVVETALRTAWGGAARAVTWPLRMRVCRL